MGLLSIFKRKSETVAVNEPADAVQKARSRARQRLIGAAVLLGIGVVGFPLVFETRPRPIPVDIPIEIPRKESAPALAMPSARVSTAPAVPTTSAAPAVADVRRPEPAIVTAPTPAVHPRNEVITETREDAGLAAPPPARPAHVARPAEAPRLSVPEPAPKPVPVPKSVAENKLPSSDHGDGARARALLEGKPSSKPETARFVLQVGAFADAAVAHEMRVKVEKLGLKTYTQVATTTDGNRIRVRVGPFGTRDEADKALAKARSAGLSAVVLTL